jgi:hypothetical protein
VRKANIKTSTSRNVVGQQKGQIYQLEIEVRGAVDHDNFTEQGKELDPTVKAIESQKTGDRRMTTRK